MLDLLRLVVVANLHFLAPHAFVFFFKTLLLISKCFERHHNLFYLVLTLMQHLFLFFVLRVKPLTFTTSVLLVPSRVLNLAILDLY